MSAVSTRRPPVPNTESAINLLAAMSLPTNVLEKPLSDVIRQQETALTRAETSKSVPTIWTVRQRICDVIGDMTKIMAGSYAADIAPLLKAASLLVEARKTLSE